MHTSLYWTHLASCAEDPLSLLTSVAFRIAAVGARTSGMGSQSQGCSGFFSFSVTLSD